nr:putative sulfate exporter family transporter [Aquibacillus saliphilus]
MLTLVLAFLAGFIARLPFLSIMGVMIISIFLGVGWKSVIGVRKDLTDGVNFSSKILLRAGIVLMGLRLNLDQIISAGTSIVLIDVVVVGFTLIVMVLLGKWFAVDEKFAALLAVGTAVCGAAAIVAVAPLIKAKKEHVAIAVAFIAILGTIGTIFYSILFAVFDLDSYNYGVLVGATLHELAHVVAAALPGGDVSSEMAILVKMGRVALLIPVAIILGSIFAYKNRSKENKGKRELKNLPIPWFIFGFLAMSMVNSTGILPDRLIDFLIAVSILLLSMAMAGLGLSINFADFKKVGMKAVVVGVIGSILLVGLGSLLIMV